MTRKTLPVDRQCLFFKIYNTLPSVFPGFSPSPMYPVCNTQAGRRHEKHASLQKLEDFNSAGYCLMTACLRFCLGAGHTHSHILRLDIIGERTLWIRLCSRHGDRAAVTSWTWGKFGVDFL